MNTKAMKSVGAYIVDERYPSRDRLGASHDPTSDEYIDEYVRGMARVDYHPAGSCKMGAVGDRTAVVDPMLRYLVD